MVINTDYANSSNWMHVDNNPKNKVDLFYLYPTVVKGVKGQHISEIDGHMKVIASVIYRWQAEILSEFTNAFAPFYPQIPFLEAADTESQDKYIEKLWNYGVVSNIYSALDYFFENFNNGRPYIFAGHSQGTTLIRVILSDYMRLHPDYLKRMIVAYGLGYSFTKEYIQSNPHLKFAEGATDTGVIVSWNTEGVGGHLPSVVLEKHTLVINPLNWRRDEVPASLSENKGSLFGDRKSSTMELVPGMGDAVNNVKRGVVVCSTLQDYMEFPMFGDKSLHFYDWPLYAENIKENARQRIDAYFSNCPYEC